MGHDYPWDSYGYDYWIILRIRRPDGKVVFFPCEEYGMPLKFDVYETACAVSGYALADVAFYYMDSSNYTSKGAQLSESEMIDDYFDNNFLIASTQSFAIEIEPSPGINQSRVSPDIVFHPYSNGEFNGNGYVDENGILWMGTGISNMTFHAPPIVNY